MKISTFVQGIIVPLVVAFFGLSPQTASADPIPTVSFAGTQTGVFLNQAAPIRVGFTNTGDQIGYYPMMEVKLPQGVQCDSTCRSGIDLVDLSGAPVTVTAFGPAASATTYTNPVTGNRVSATVGETVLFISLPTGSVSPGQSAITYSIPATLAPSAQLGVPLPLNATGVFVLGAIPNGDRGACGAAGVDTICATATTTNITPALLRLQKSVENLVDGATSTGPSYPRRFKIDATVANSETVTAVVVTDTIPSTFVLTSLPGANCKTTPGSLTFTPALAAGDTCAFSGSASGGGTLTVTYASVTGITGVDRSIQYEGYVQKFAGGVAGSHVVPPTTGDTTSTNNTAQANYSYDPGTGAVSLSTAPQSVVLEQRSLYTTKSIAKVSPAGTTIGPGSTLRHTLIYDISDYFSFDDLQISDSIGDGQTYVGGTLSVAVYEGSSSPVSRTEAQLQAATGSPLGPITRNPTTGVWSINLDLSQALVASAPNGYGASDGVLEGDLNRSPPFSSGSPTRVVITYDTTIDEEFTGPVLGTVEVDGGDVISDTMGADFRVAGTSNRQTLTGPTAQVTVTAIQQFEKVVAFENGAAPSNPLRISPSETITYKISFTVPTGDVEGLVISDFVPSPLFDVLDPDADGVASSFTFDATPSDAAPASGHMHITTASAAITLSPTVNGTANSISVAFDNETNVTSDETFIEFLFTMTATNKPMANDLLLVNVVYLSQNSSQSSSPINQLSSVAPLLTSQPEIVVRKFAASVVTGSGTVSGSGADANFTNVSPAARLGFTVEIENTGGYDAVDVSFNDILPAPFTYVAASLTNSNCDTAGGITDTSSSSQLQVSGMELPQGQICTLQYQVDLAADAALGGVITNTAVVRFASTPGGPLFSPVRDNATTTINSPSLTKALVAGTSSDPDTSEGILRAGESADFDVTVTVPPGTASSFIVRELDTASGGTSNNFFENFSASTITFPSIEQNAACAGGFNFVGNTDLCFSLNPSGNTSQHSSTEHRVSFGTVRNSSSTNQIFTLRYHATLRSGLTAGAYTNKANVQWTTQNANSSGTSNGTVTSLTATSGFTVARPRLVLSKSTTTTPPVRFGDTVTYTVTLANTGTAIAHDVADIVDILPAGLGTASLVSATLNSASVTGAAGFSSSQSGSRLTITVRNLSGLAKLSPGDSYVVTYSVPVTQEVNGSAATLVNYVSVASYASGSIDGGPRETLTDVTPATVTIGVDSNNITGRVIFSKETAGSGDQNGVVGSTVSIVGTPFTTPVDANGNFSFSGVPDGTYTIRAVNPFGDLISEQTITVNNADVKNIVFQARPRIVLTKTTSTVGPVSPGSTITYTVTLQNVGNYPAYQVGDIEDTLVNGMGTVTLVSATYQGSSVVGVGDFALSQTGLVVTIPVRNTSGDPQIDVGRSFVVTYQVPVSTTLKASAITIPNSAEIARYATSDTTTSSTEQYVDVRCGEVRLDLTGQDPACVASSLESSLTSMNTRSTNLMRGVARALALRRDFTKAGYCNAVDNGCYRCNAAGAGCFNVCRRPSAKGDNALLAKATKLGRDMDTIISSTLVKEHSPLVCATHKDCSLVDQGGSVAALEKKTRRLADITSDILNSCCMRTRRAAPSFKNRKLLLDRQSKRDLRAFSTLVSKYPSPALVCP
jgi:uncharacterized repeat protein (TIGR01451 family)/fimbrial isopeptide formation D2 family protein